MIIITGASDGLGLQLAKIYNEAGIRVVNISRRNSEHADVNILTDLTNEGSIKKSIDKVLEIDEPIEALVNCAGVLSFEAIGSITNKEIERVFSVNIKAPILIVSGLSEKLKQDNSDIINVSSTVGLKAYPDQAVYGSSKWAMRGFSQNLQIELKKTNRIVSFCVGGFNSGLATKVTGESITDPENWMNPEDIAKFMKQILELPKSMEVSEIIINRKAAE
jgi:NADP-dependent 3-hydroxy acid dehydrogenase YdfG